MKTTLRIALPARSSPGELQQRRCHGAGQDSSAQGQGAVNRREHDDAGEREVTGQQGERPEGRRLATVSLTGRAKRGGGCLTRATRTGAINAGRKPVPLKSALVAKALPVRSKTSSERATIPIQSPSSLIAKVTARRRNTGLRSGSLRRELRTTCGCCYLIYAQVSLQMHRF